MSDSAREDLAAFRELEQLIRALGAEMDGWRRRAHAAEARQRELEQRVGGDAAPAVEVAELERENAELRKRLESATERTRELLGRVRFLRQQEQQGAER